MNPIELVEVANNSERVRHLLAATIAAGIRREYGIQLSAADASDLARGHDLRSAIESFRKKMEIHKEIDSERARNRIVVLETKLDGSDRAHIRESILENVVKGRAETHKLDSLTNLEQKRMRADHLMLLQLRSKIQEWGPLYRSFLRGLERLYEKRKRELLALRLSPVQFESALAEVEAVIVAAADASTSCEMSSATVA